MSKPLPVFWYWATLLFCLVIQSRARSWQTHPAGSNGTVSAIASSGIRVYIGGDFTSLTTTPSASVPGSSYLAVSPNGQLYVAGLLTSVSETAANGAGQTEPVVNQWNIPSAGRFPPYLPATKRFPTSSVRQVIARSKYTACTAWSHSNLACADTKVRHTGLVGPVPANLPLTHSYS